MNKQSYPEYLFKHLRRNSKRILSIMLAFAILTENPLSAYASTKATPSNIPESSASIKSTDTNIDIDTDFGVEDIETNPDHGPGIDSTTPTYPYYRPVVDTSTVPDEVEMNNDDLDAILEAGANCIDDFDPDSLVPIPQEQVEYALSHQSENVFPDNASIYEEEEIYSVDAQSTLVIPVAVGALMAIWWYCGSSGFGADSLSTVANKIESLASNTSLSESFSYLKDNVVQRVTITTAVMANLYNKLNSAKTSSGYSITLTEEDKAALIYATTKAANGTSFWRFDNLDLSNINIKELSGCKYYYVYPYSYDPDYNAGQCHVLYCADKIAYAVCTNYNMTFYHANAALADYGFEPITTYTATYMLSGATGFYEYKSSFKNEYTLELGNSSRRFLCSSAMPFPCVYSGSRYGDFQSYIASTSPLLLDTYTGIKSASMKTLLNTDSITFTGDAISTVESKKNILSTTSGINSAAGTVTGTGSMTKPGTSTGTDTGTGGGTTTTPDYSGSLSNILGTLGTILAAVNGIPNILSLFQLLPTTIKDSIVDALKSIPFFESALLYLSLISTGVQDILDWDIEAWIDGVNTDLGNAIDNLGTNVLQRLANLPNIDNLGGIIGAALAGSSPILKMADAVVNIADKLKTWNIDNYGDTFIKALETAMAALGLGSLSGTLGALKDLTDVKLDDVLAKLQELAASLAGLKLGVDLDSLSDVLKEVLTALGLGSLLGAVTNIGSMIGTFSFPDLLNLIKALPASIVSAITEALPNWRTPESEETENDSGFHNFLNLFMVGLLIIILLMILFINCLRFIVLVFNIPASSALIHADMLRGIEYMKNLQIPVFGVSLYALLLSCAYFVIFMTVIAAIRRKIDKMHI